MQDESRTLPLRVGVALSAGSAAAMAEIGALEVLQEAGLPISCVAGTSAGSIVGAAFASGHLEALRKRLSGLTRSGVMRLFDPAWPREGLLHGRRALEFIRPDLGETIEALDLPFAAVATDLRTGEEVVLRAGPVFDAVRASIAIPGIFTPWRVGGRLLVDGGLVDPVPVTVARELGAEFVIAMNVLPLHEIPAPRWSLREHLRLIASPGRNHVEPTSAPTMDGRPGLTEVIWRATRILQAQVATTRLRADQPGWLMQIQVPEVGMFDVHRTPELVECGRRCAEEALPGLLDALEKAVPLYRRLLEWPRRNAERRSRS